MAPMRTRGPWAANPECRKDMRVPVVGGNTELVALVQCVLRPGRIDYRAQEANARLIAAAPEMFAVLHRVRALIDNGYLRDPDWEWLTLDQKAASKQQSVYDQITALLRRIDDEPDPPDA